MRDMAFGTVRMALRLLAIALRLARVGAFRARLGPLVAMVAALAVRPAIGLDAVRVEAARLLLGLLGSGLEPLQFGSCLDEVFRKRSNVDLHAGQPLDVAQQAALVMRAEGNRLALGARASGPANTVDVL